jgi:hypothetical protein
VPAPPPPGAGSAGSGSGSGSAAAPKIISASLLKLVSGTKTIEPDDVTKTEIQRSGKTKVIAAFKLCLDAAGAPSLVSKVKSSGFDAYDQKIDQAIHAWKAQPVIVDGAPGAVCTAVLFTYQVPEASSSTTTSTSSSSSDGDCPTQLMDDARAAAKNTQWGKALRLCEQRLACDKGDNGAVLVCAIAACNMKNTAKAKAYISRLSSSQQSFARQSCLRNGVDPGGG